MVQETREHREKAQKDIQDFLNGQKPPPNATMKKILSDLGAMGASSPNMNSKESSIPPPTNSPRRETRRRFLKEALRSGSGG